MGLDTEDLGFQNLGAIYVSCVTLTSLSLGLPHLYKGNNNTSSQAQCECGIIYVCVRMHALVHVRDEVLSDLWRQGHVP